jgi:predicted nucleic acid-binding protein
LSQLLISDANILIDVEDGDLIAEFFKLPFEFHVPDLLFVDELEESHAHLLDYGLKLSALSPESMAEAERLVKIYSQPSRYDCFALVLAKQKECPLLTGDRRLRKAAEKEQVEVKGTIWIMGELLKNKIITVQDAQIAYDKMKAKGRRLPLAEVEKQLAEIYR